MNVRIRWCRLDPCGEVLDLRKAVSRTKNPTKEGDRRVIELCAYWHPAGFWGLLYWYAHLPLYSPLVHSAVAEVARRAESLDARVPL